MQKQTVEKERMNEKPRKRKNKKKKIKKRKKYTQNMKKHKKEALENYRKLCAVLNKLSCMQTTKKTFLSQTNENNLLRENFFKCCRVFMVFFFFFFSFSFLLYKPLCSLECWKNILCFFNLQTWLKAKNTFLKHSKFESGLVVRRKKKQEKGKNPGTPKKIMYTKLCIFVTCFKKVHTCF